MDFFFFFPRGLKSPERQALVYETARRDVVLPRSCTSGMRRRAGALRFERRGAQSGAAGVADTRVLVAAGWTAEREVLRLSSRVQHGGEVRMRRLGVGGRDHFAEGGDASLAARAT